MNDNPLENFAIGTLIIVVSLFVIWGGVFAPLCIESRGNNIKKYKQILVENNLAAYNVVGEFYLLENKEE